MPRRQRRRRGPVESGANSHGLLLAWTLPERGEPPVPYCKRNDPDSTRPGNPASTGPRTRVPPGATMSIETLARQYCRTAAIELARHGIVWSRNRVRQHVARSLRPRRDYAAVVGVGGQGWPRTRPLALHNPICSNGIGWRHVYTPSRVFLVPSQFDSQPDFGGSQSSKGKRYGRECRQSVPPG